MKKQRLISVFLLATAISGCAGSKPKLLDKDLPTIKQIYTEKLDAVADTEQRQHVRPLKYADGDLQGVIREPYRKLAQTFPYLPNPILVMYVFPHLTPAGTPIPGYSTYFKFYEADQVALPYESKTIDDPIPTVEGQP